MLRAYNAEQGLERAERNDPDAIFIDVDLPAISGAELTRQMLERDVVSKAAPIFLISSGHISRDQKLQALEAGVWDVLSLPVDAEELLLRIERYSRGKLEADRLKEDALVDALTGLYSWQGISRRIGEVAAAASRYGRALSCIVVTISEETEEGTTKEALPDEVSSVARQLRAAVRDSDILARIGPNEFAVIAPDTPGTGAEVLASRLKGMSSRPESPFRAGVYSVDNLKTAKVDPIEFLLRATRATHQNRAN